jgi:hypothetical protein
MRAFDAAHVLPFTQSQRTSYVLSVPRGMLRISDSNGVGTLRHSSMTRPRRYPSSSFSSVPASLQSNCEASGCF